MRAQIDTASTFDASCNTCLQVIVLCMYQTAVLFNLLFDELKDFSTRAPIFGKFIMKHSLDIYQMVMDNRTVLSVLHDLS